MTLTSQQFEALKQRLSQKNGGQGYGSRVASEVKQRFGEATESLTQSMEGTKNPLVAGANLAKNVSGIALSPLTQAPGIRQIGEGFSKASQAIVDTKVGNQVTDFLAEKVSPEALGAVSDTLETGLNVLTLTGAAKTAQGIPSTLKSGIETTKSGLTKAKTAISRIPNRIAKTQIDKRSQTILREVPPEKLDLYRKAGEESMVDPRKLSPIEQAGEGAVRMNQIIKEDLGKIGAQKAKTLESVGEVRTPNIATKQVNKIKPLLQKKLTDTERQLVSEYINELSTLGKNPTARSVDATIDKLQATLFEKSKGVSIPTTPRIKAFINQSIKELNSDLKNLVDKTLGSKDYSSLNSAYQRKITMFRFLNKGLSEGGTRGGSLFNRFFSTADSSVKKLFEAIKQDYGIDLAQDATLARFVMETLRDQRIRPYLQLPPMSARGLVEKGLDLVQETLVSPKKVLETAKKETRPISSLGEALKE